MTDLRDSDFAFHRMESTVTSYADKCCQICWQMCSRRHPIVFGPLAKCGEVFNPQLYDAYNLDGPYVDYVVWPPLLLCRGGPLLCKGIVVTNQINLGL